MSVLLTSQQQIVVSQIMQKLDDSTCSTTNLGVLLVGSPGVGMSTCIDQVKKITTHRFIDLRAFDSHSVFSLGEWLGKIFGLESVRVSMHLKTSLSLISMLEIIGVSMLVIEDAHVINSPGHRARTLDRIIEEFRKLKSKIPRVKLLMTIQAAEMSSIKFSDSNLSNMFDVITVRPITFGDLTFFVDNQCSKELKESTAPVFSERVLLAMYKFSEGSIGRAILIIGLMRSIFYSEGDSKENDETIIQLISKLKG